MVWFRYLSNKEVLGTTTPNENYSYPLLKRQISKFTPKDTVPDKTWLFVDVTDLNIDKYYDANLQLQTDDASYVVVYEDPFTDDYFVPVKTVIHEDILYFETAEEHPAGVEIDKQYAVYYKTKGLRKIAEVDNGGRKDYQIFDLPIWIDKELSNFILNVEYNNSVYAYSNPVATYAISKGRLPSGITLNSVTGAVTGTTSYVGSYFFTIRATSIHGYVEEQFSGNILGLPEPEPTQIPNFYNDKNYYHNFAIESEIPITYIITDGSLPNGVALDPQSGIATGIVEYNYKKDLSYSFTIGYQSESGITTQSYSGYIYRIPEIVNPEYYEYINDNATSYSDEIEYIGYPEPTLRIEKFNLTSNGLYISENSAISYDKNLYASILEFPIEQKKDEWYLSTGYPQLPGRATSIESDNSGGFFLGGNFIAFDNNPITELQKKSIYHINSSSQISTWSLKRNSIEHKGIDTPGFIKNIGSNLYIGMQSGAIYESLNNKSIEYKFAVVDKDSGNILDLNLSTDSGKIVDLATIGENIYIVGKFNSVNLPSSSSIKYDLINSTSLPNYPISVGSTVYAIVEDSFGGYYIGGTFTSINGNTRNRVAYINSLGKLDDWNPNVNGPVYSINLIGSNIYVGGQFTAIGTQYAGNFGAITRLGQPLRLNLNVNGSVKTIEVLDSNIYIGGEFTKISFPVLSAENSNSVLSWLVRSRYGIAALNTSMSLLELRVGLASGITSNVSTIKINTDNIYVGGKFEEISYPISSLYNINKNGIVYNNALEISPNVYSIQVDATGGYYIGGNFKYVGNENVPGLAYIDSSGILTSWNPGIDGTIHQVLLSGDNVYVVGNFKTSSSSLNRHYAIVTVAGELLDVNPSINDNVYSIQIHNGIVYLGGSFTSINENARNYLAAINEFGDTLDWNPNANAQIRTMYISGDNIYVGGDFTLINQNVRTYIAAINTSAGILSWNVNVSGNVHTISSYQNIIYVGGSFSYNSPNQKSSLYTTNLNGTQIINIYGVQSRSFCLEYDSFGGIYFGGDFTSVNGVTRNRLAYINSSGQLGTWNPSADGLIRSMAIRGDNLYVSGDFNTINGIYRPKLAAIDSSGNILNWNPGTDGQIENIYIYGDGATPNIYIAGNYNVLGYHVSNFIKLKDNGTFIESQIRIPNVVRAVQYDASGGVYIGGDFTSINGVQRNRLAYMSASGSITSLSINVNGTIRSIAVLGSNIYFGGDFTSVNENSRPYLAAINSSGNLLDWNPKPNQKVHTIKVINENIYFGGEFTFVWGTSRNRLAGVNLSGNLLTWNPNVNNTVYTLATNGTNIYIGGAFTSVNGNVRNRLAVVNTAANVLSWNPNVNTSSSSIVYAIAFAGNIVYVGGSFNTLSPINQGTLTRNYIAAVNATGNVTTWNPNANGNVWSIGSFGQNIYFGGAFTSVNPTGTATARNYIASFSTAGQITTWNPSLNNTVRTISIYQDGATPNFAMGGDFTAPTDRVVKNLGKVNINGALYSWRPDPNGTVYAVTGYGSNIYVGGNFTTISGVANKHRIAVYSSSDTIQTWGANVSSVDENGYVKTIAVSNDIVYVGGTFLHLNLEKRLYAGAFTTSSSGAVLSWNPNVDAQVKDIKIRQDGGLDSIYLVGDFTRVNENYRYYAAAFNADGTLLDWNPSADASISGLKIYGQNISIVGDFTDINNIRTPYLFSVDQSGQKTNWNPKVNNTVNKIAIYGEGATPNIYVAGEFTSINNSDQKYIAAVDINADLIDWKPRVNNSVNEVFIQNENIYIGGSFDFLIRSKRKNIVAINTSNQILDFDISPDAAVNDMDLFGSNIYLAGEFTSIKGGKTSLSKINITNNKIIGPMLEVNQKIYDILVDNSNGIYICGEFTSVNNIERYRLAHIDSNGIVTSWNPSSDGIVYSMTMDNKNIYIGGDFSSISGQPRYSIAGISKSGSLLDWNPPVGGGWYNGISIYPSKIVRAIWISGDNIFIGGKFRTVAGQDRVNLAKLNTAGNVLSWNPGYQFSGEVNNLVEINGYVYVSGNDTTINMGLSVYDSDTGTLIAQGPTEFAGERSIKKLKVSGNNILATAILNTASGFSGVLSINSLSGFSINWITIADIFTDGVVDSFGSNIYISGDFNRIGGGWSSSYIYNKSSQDITNIFVRDTLFINSLSIIYSYAFDNLGGIYIGGSFSRVSNASNGYITENRNGLLYINSLGELDDWNPNVTGNVYAIKVIGSNIYIGGQFTRVNGNVRDSFAVINTSGNVLATEIGTGFNATAVVNSIEVAGDNIFIGGNFTQYLTISSYVVLNQDAKSATGVPSVGLNVHAMAFDFVGGIYLGGSFTTIEGVARNGLAYINSSGQLTPWNPSTNGNVLAIVVSGEGATPEIYIGGQFTSVNGSTRNRLAVLNSSGVLLDWDPNVDGNVCALAFSNNVLYVGGGFQNINGNTRSRLGAITAAVVNVTANILDWNPSANSNVFAIAVSSDGIYVGGQFTSFTPPVQGAIGRNRIALLSSVEVNANSNVLNWNPNANSNIFTIAISDTAIYVGGNVTSFTPLVQGLTTRNRIAAISPASLNATGNVLNWNPSANGNVLSIAVSGSNIYFGGQFATVNAAGTAITRNFIAAVSANGSLLSWDPNASANVRTILVSGSNIYIGGDFNLIRSLSNTRNRLMAINTSGNVLAWNPNANANVYAIAASTDAIYIGGSFTSLAPSGQGTVTRSKIAAISLPSVNATGNVLQWNPSAPGTSNVFAIAVSNEAVYIGGSFTSLAPSGQGTVTRSKIAAISLPSVNATGNVLQWNPSAPGTSNVFAIAASTDAIYIGGSFTSLAPSGQGTVTRNRLAAISLPSVNATGNVLQWNPSASGNVNSIAISGDNVYIGGNANWVRSSYINKFAILNTDGQVTNWTSNVNIIPSLDSLKVDNNGDIYISGYSGSYLISDLEKGYLLSVNTEGEILDWNPSANSLVRSIKVVGDNIYFGGDFTSVDGDTSRSFIAAESMSNQAIALSELSNNLDINGPVYTITSSINTLFIGGLFNDFSINNRTNLLAINTSGRILSWSPNTDSDISGITTVGDNIYISGKFSLVNNISRNKLAGLTTNGDILDWNPGQAIPGTNSLYNVETLNAKGEVIYIGTNFIYPADPIEKPGPKNIAVLDENAMPIIVTDSTIPNDYVYAVTLDASGGIYIGGDFTSISGVPRNRLAYIDNSGSLSTWNPNVNSTVRAIAVSGDNVYIGGDFTSLAPSGQGTVTRNYLAAVNTPSVNATGNVVQWNPSANDTVHDIKISGSNTYCVGEFSIVSGQPRRGIAAISMVGSLLTWGTSLLTNYIYQNSYASSAVTTPNVRAIAISGDNIYVGGEFVISSNVNTSKTLITNLGGTIVGFNYNTKILAVAPDGSGGFYVGGNFTSISGVLRNRLAYINSSSEISTWNPNVNSTVRAIAVSGDSVYIGGDFTSLAPSGQGTVTRNYLAAVNTPSVNATGNVAQWNPSADSIISSISVIGLNIYINGYFSSIDGVALGATAFGGTFRRIAAVNTAGKLVHTGTVIGSGQTSTSLNVAMAISGDNIYLAPSNTSILYGIYDYTGLYGVDFNGEPLKGIKVTGNIFTAVEDALGGIYIGGDFRYINNQPRNRLAYIDSSGNLGSWNPNANGNVWAISLDGNNVYIGGDFTQISGTSRSFFALVTSTGTLSSLSLSISGTINAGTSAGIRDISVLGNNIYIGGNFTTMSGSIRNGAGAINKSGSLLTTWNPNLNNVVFAIKTFGSNIYIGGAFTSVSGTARNRLAIVSSNGTLSSWNPNADANVYEILVDSSIIYVGGSFNYINSKDRTYFAKLDHTGQVFDNLILYTETIFSNDSKVNSIKIQGENIFIGGRFANSIAIDGTKNKVFNIEDKQIISIVANGDVATIVPDNFGGAYIGGSFTSVAGQPRNRLAYIDSSGNLGSWNPNANGNVYSMSIYGSNIYVGGAFNFVNGDSRNGLAAIDSFGNILNWNPNCNSNVFSIIAQNNIIYVGGQFTSVNGNTRNRLAAINTSGNVLAWNPNANNIVYVMKLNGDNIYIGGDFTSIKGKTRNYLASVNTGGNLLYWNPNANSSVKHMGILGSNIFVGGTFTQIGGIERKYITGISKDGFLTTDIITTVTATSIKSITTFGENLYLSGVYSNTYFIDVVNTLGYTNSLEVHSHINTQINESIAVSNNNIYIGKVVFDKSELRKHTAAFNLQNLYPLDVFSKVFSGNFYAEVFQIALTSSAAYVAGNHQYTNYGRSSLKNIHMINSSGLVSSLDVNVNDSIYLMTQIGSNIYMTGDFTYINGNLRNGLAAINTSNKLLNWNPKVNGDIYSIAKSGSTIYISGNFTRANGIERKYIAGFDTQANLLDSNFEKVDEPIELISVSSQKILVSGNFNSKYDDIQGKNFIGLTKSTGELLPIKVIANGIFRYRSSWGQSVQAIEVFGDNIYIGGEFGRVNGAIRHNLAAINTSGTLLQFANSMSYGDGDGKIYSIKASDNAVYIGGFFGFTDESYWTNSTYFYEGVSNLVKLDITGNIMDWYPGLQYSEVYDIQLSGSNVYVGGRFELGRNRSDSLAAFNLMGEHLSLQTLPMEYSIQSVSKIKFFGDNIYTDGYIIDKFGQVRYNEIPAVNASSFSFTRGRYTFINDILIYNEKIYYAGFFATHNLPGGLSLNENTKQISGNVTHMSREHIIELSVKNEIGYTTGKKYLYNRKYSIGDL